MFKYGWIPANIPPAQDGLYLTTAIIPNIVHDIRFHYTCEFTEGIWKPEYNIMTILAWMPLPELYKAGD